MTLQEKYKTNKQEIYLNACPCKIKIGFIKDIYWEKILVKRS
jgi:hypothetical protein